MDDMSALVWPNGGMHSVGSSVMEGSNASGGDLVESTGRVGVVMM